MGKGKKGKKKAWAEEGSESVDLTRVRDVADVTEAVLEEVFQLRGKHHNHSKKKKIMRWG